jgi:hypothetical protein
VPRVPIVIWARDPWDARDRAEVATLRIPGRKSQRPAGTRAFDTGSLKQVALLSRFMRRPMLVGATSPFVAAKVKEAYGFDPGAVHFLPNIVDPAGRIEKSARPTVAFLGRLDPTKRPWLFAALAEHFPDVEFVVMGQSHFNGRNTWTARNLPANLHLLGHLDGEKSWSNFPGLGC